MATKSLPSQLTQRTPLQDVIPLDTPYSVLLSPIDYCNIKCVFCPFHGAVKDNTMRKPHIMSMDLYKNIIDQLAAFPNQLRALIFCGRGEPTMHKNLPEMISYAKEKGVTDTIRMTTNGFNLSPDLNQKLINAGLDYVKISVPAIDEKTCFEITGVKLDLKQYVDNITHLFKNKRNDMTIYCKSTNVALGGKGGGEPLPELADKFYAMFEGISDYCFIENIVPQVIRKLTEDEMKNMWIENFEAKNIYNLDAEHSNTICERLFYHFTINSIGDVFPCDLNENEALKLGNIQQVRLQDIWNGETLKNLRIASLTGNIPGACADCAAILYDYQNELHKYANDIHCRLLRK